MFGSTFEDFFYQKWGSLKISYIVYISPIWPNIVYISLVSLKKISLRPGGDGVNDEDDGGDDYDIKLTQC